jgi:membrane protein YqaA with SNARE-associated domain
MRSTRLFIILALFIQEPASTDAAIFQVRHLHLNLLLINVIWLVATLIDIWGGYYLGKWVQNKFQGTRFANWAHKWAGRIENFIGKKGETFALILLGIINFPYANTFLASWLSIPFRTVFMLILAGDVIYWAIEWAINISVRSFFVDPHTALYVIIGAALIFSIVSKAILNKVLKKTEK